MHASSSRNAPDSYRARLDAFMHDPQGRSIEQIQQALARLEYPLAELLLYTRARCNESVPIDLVCEVITRANMLTIPFLLFLLADGDRVAAVVHMIETDAFPSDAIGLIFTAAFVVAADQLDASHRSRPRLAAGVRVLARALIDLPPSAIRTHVVAAFQLVATQLDDTVLAEMMPRRDSGALPPELAIAQRRMTLSREQLVALPTLYDDSWAPIARQLEDIATFAPMLSRSALCWCQSGKKYKRCHGGDERPTGPRESFEARNHRTFTVFDVQTFPLNELARVRFHQLGDEPLANAFERLVKYRAWDLAERALDALASREHLGRDVVDHIRRHLVSRATQCCRWDLVAKHVKKLRSPRFAWMKENVDLLIPVVERAPNAIDQLLRFAERVVHTPKGAADECVALLLHGMPALGILLLRAEIAVGTVEGHGGEFLALDQARVRMGLAPGDPAEAMFDQWQAAVVKARDAEAQERKLADLQAEKDTLRSQAVETHRQNRDLARRIDDLERQLREQAAEQAAQVSVQVDADPAELRAFRDKVEQLQALVRDKNLELAKLRRDQRASGAAERATEGDAGDRATLESDAMESSLDEERWEVENEQVQERRARVPVWRPALIADIESIPAHVVREAMRTVGDLAIGDAAAWRAVKQARGMTTPVRMVRIGIHHRLLFGTSDRTLDVMELVSRESLNVALKRYM